MRTVCCHALHPPSLWPETSGSEYLKYIETGIKSENLSGNVTESGLSEGTSLTVDLMKSLLLLRLALGYIAMICCLMVLRVTFSRSAAFSIFWICFRIVAS